MDFLEKVQLMASQGLRTRQIAEALGFHGRTRWGAFRVVMSRLGRVYVPTSGQYMTRADAARFKSDLERKTEEFRARFEKEESE